MNSVLLYYIHIFGSLWWLLSGKPRGHRFKPHCNKGFFFLPGGLQLELANQSSDGFTCSAKMHTCCVIENAIYVDYLEMH